MSTESKISSDAIRVGSAVYDYTKKPPRTDPEFIGYEKILVLPGGIMNHSNCSTCSIEFVPELETFDKCLECMENFWFSGMNQRQQKYYKIVRKLADSINWKVLSPYDNADLHMIFKCDKNHIRNMSPSGFKTGHRCAICNGVDWETAKKDFDKLMETQNWILIGEYTNNNTPVKTKCDKGHIRNIRPADFKNGTRCAICYGNDLETAKKEFEELVQKENWILIGKYINKSTNVEMKCDKGHPRNMKPNDFKTGYRCGICKNKTEIKILSFLNTLNFKITYQKKFDECINPVTGKYLAFDFCIEEMKFIIELDGRQHFEDIKYWDSSYEKISDRDVFKMKRALEAGYIVYRIVQEDIWLDKYDWKTALLNLINDGTYEPQVIYGDESGIYKNHQQKMDLLQTDEKNIDLGDDCGCNTDLNTEELIKNMSNIHLEFNNTKNHQFNMIPKLNIVNY